MPLIMSLAFTGLCLKKKAYVLFLILIVISGGVDLVRSSLTFGKGSCVRISDIYFFLYAAC